MTRVMKPENVREVLLRGETEWLPVRSMQSGHWRLEDGTPGERGKRGWIITLDDGEIIFLGVTAIEGLR